MNTHLCYFCGYITASNHKMCLLAKQLLRSSDFEHPEAFSFIIRLDPGIVIALLQVQYVTNPLICMNSHFQHH